MGKNIKSYATIPSPFPREREGSLTAKVLKFFVLNMVRLNRTHYLHLQFTNKIFQFFKIAPQSQIPANYADSTQFAHTVRELREIRRPFINIIHYVSDA